MSDRWFVVCLAVGCWILGAGFSFSMRFLWIQEEKPIVPLTQLVLFLVALTLGWTFALDAFISWLRGLPPDQEDKS